MKVPGGAEKEVILARRIFLDALFAMGEHRNSFVLVGAQAIYLHVGEASMAVAPFTTDGDLAIDPDLLADDPMLGDLLKAAGFLKGAQPGMWHSPEGVRIDLMVPEAIGGRPGRRGADLGPHGKNAARQARGLEGALVENELMTIAALEEDDKRSVQLRVAGPAAMLVAKLHKLSDRQIDTARLAGKDGLDVLRILRGSPTSVLAANLRQLCSDPRSAEVSQIALRFLDELFGRADAPGSLLAAEAARPLEDEQTIAQSCQALTQDLLEALREL